MKVVDKNQEISELIEEFGLALNKLKSVMEIECVRRPYILAFKTIEAKHRMILQEIDRYDSNNIQYPEALKKEILHYMRTIQNLREEVGVKN